MSRCAALSRIRLAAACPKRCPLVPGDMGKGGQVAPAPAFDPSLVGAFATLCPGCPGCPDAACCAPAIPTDDSAAANDVEDSPDPAASNDAAAAGVDADSLDPAASPTPPSRGTRVLKVTTDAPGGRGDPADPVNVQAEFLRCLNGLTPACVQGAGASQLLTPDFKYAVPVEKLAAKLETDEMHSIRDDHTADAKRVLDSALERFGSAETLEHNVYGEEVDQDEAQKHITEFVEAHNLQDKLWVRFTPNRVSCVGSLQRSRKNSQDHLGVRHTLFVSTANRLRQHELRQFVAHEVGTHLIRVINDELQPWRGSSGRKRFQLHTNSTREFRETEEGLATINTVLHAGGNACYLWREALLYYACAKAGTLSFVELFVELAPYMPNAKRRFGLVTRIKRGLADQSQPGGSGKAQVYFEGAVTILRRDFGEEDLKLLYAGRLMLSELQRVRRIAHTSFITLPAFAVDLPAYRQQLRAMAVLNGLVPAVVPRGAGLARASTASTAPSEGDAAAAKDTNKATDLSKPKLLTKLLAAKRLAAKRGKGGKRGKRKPQRTPAAAPPSPPRGTPPAKPRTPTPPRSDPTPAVRRDATAPPPPRATTDAAPKLPRITRDHWTRARRWHAKHMPVAVVTLTL